jgi:exonuclease I
MKLLTRREYNLILRALDKYEVYMNKKEEELREDLEEKLYNNFYNPKDKVAQTDINLPALYDIKTEKDKSEDNVIKSLNFRS